MKYRISVDYNTEKIEAKTITEVFDMLRVLDSESIFRVAVYRTNSKGEAQIFIEKTISYHRFGKDLKVDFNILFEEELDAL